MEQNITPRSPAAVIIFSLITCGIYAIYWIYQFSVEMYRVALQAFFSF